jgi:hypothetical protein
MMALTAMGNSCQAVILFAVAERFREETTMKSINTSNWDKFSKRVLLGLVVSALVAAVFLLAGIYIVGA